MLKPRQLPFFLAKSGWDKAKLRDCIDQNYYRMDFTLNSIRKQYDFDVSCQGSVPQALTAFLEADSFEDTIRNAVSIGGDSDTIAAIAGSTAQAYYGVPLKLRNQILPYLDKPLIEVLNAFEEKYG